MRRRSSILLLASGASLPALWPLAVLTKQAKMFRVGILNFDNPEPFGTMLRSGLRGLGYVEGQNVQLEYRAAEGDRTRLDELAAELVGLKCDVIVAYPTPAAIAVKQLTREMPIVLLGAGDPIATGLVASLSRPGGNVTGTSSTTPEAGTKTLEVLRDMLPALRRVGVLANAIDPFTTSYLDQMRNAAEAQRMDIRIIAITKSDELDAAFSGFKNDAVDAIVVQPSLPRAQIAALAMRHRMPSIAPAVSFAALGGLAGFSASNKEMARRTVAYVDKILKGSKPADLPVEQPTTFELVINLKTAKALGVTVPPTLLARADEVIE